MKQQGLTMKRLFALIVIPMALMSTAVQAGVNMKDNRPAIVMVAFGTSVEEGRKVYEHIDSQARRRFPEYKLRWAFTSQFIIDKLKRRGVVTHNIDETIAQLRKEGVNQVVFQSLHIAPGEEYRSVLAADTRGLKVAYGDALLTSDEDIDRTVDALRPFIRAEQGTVLAAHGNDRYPQFNQRILAFARRIERECPRLVVASVEGSPGLEPLQKIKKMQLQQVNFVPLMIVAGDHILNDVLGDKEDSWKKIIAAPEAKASASLGWNDAILDIYFDHLDTALQQVVQ